jgi:undecaprenyl-diphosphatase
VIGLDHRLERWVVGHRGEPFDSFFVALTHIGSWGIVWIVLAAIGALVWRRPAVLPLTVIADVAGDVVSTAVKLVVRRHRPADHPLVHQLVTYSFPSGHATTSFACAATLARFAPRNVVALLYLLAALISFSRVYVGVHYPLDVLAGAALGLVVATGLRTLPAALRRSPRPRRAG